MKWSLVLCLGLLVALIQSSYGYSPDKSSCSLTESYIISYKNGTGSETYSEISQTSLKLLVRYQDNYEHVTSLVTGRSSERFAPLPSFLVMNSKKSAVEKCGALRDEDNKILMAHSLYTLLEFVRDLDQWKEAAPTSQFIACFENTLVPGEKACFIDKDGQCTLSTYEKGALKMEFTKVQMEGTFEPSEYEKFIPNLNVKCDMTGREWKDDHLISLGLDDFEYEITFPNEPWANETLNRKIKIQGCYENIPGYTIVTETAPKDVAKSIAMNYYETATRYIVMEKLGDQSTTCHTQKIDIVSDNEYPIQRQTQLYIKDSKQMVFGQPLTNWKFYSAGITFIDGEQFTRLVLNESSFTFYDGHLDYKNAVINVLIKISENGKEFEVSRIQLALPQKDNVDEIVIQKKEPVLVTNQMLDIVRSFDIRSCGPIENDSYETSIEVEIAMNKTYNASDYRDNLDMVGLSFRTSLVEMLGLNTAVSMRFSIPIIEVYEEERVMYFNFKILELQHIDHFFTDVIKDLAIQEPDSTVHTETLEECRRVCYQDTRFGGCTMFSFDPTSKMCLLSIRFKRSRDLVLRKDSLFSRLLYKSMPRQVNSGDLVEKLVNIQNGHKLELRLGPDLLVDHILYTQFQNDLPIIIDEPKLVGVLYESLSKKKQTFQQWIHFKAELGYIECSERVFNFMDSDANINGFEFVNLPGVGTLCSLGYGPKITPEMQDPYSNVFEYVPENVFQSVQVYGLDVIKKYFSPFIYEVPTPVSTLRECANLCLKSPALQCVAFFYRVNETVCLLSQRYSLPESAYWSSDSATQGYLTYYTMDSRAVFQQTALLTSVSEALINKLHKVPTTSDAGKECLNAIRSNTTTCQGFVRCFKDDKLEVVATMEDYFEWYSEAASPQQGATKGDYYCRVNKRLFEHRLGTIVKQSSTFDTLIGPSKGAIIGTTVALFFIGLVFGIALMVLRARK